MSVSARTRRLTKEIKDCETDSASGIKIKRVGDSLDRLVGTFNGPDGTPYAGGIYDVDITVPSDYPFKPLKMSFKTKVFHPNISSQTGAICLDILKNSWSPVLTLKSTLISLQSLLCSPEPNDPQDAQVAGMYLKDRKLFEATAREWTQKFAMPGGEGAKKLTQPDSPPKSTAITSAQSEAITRARLNTEDVTRFSDMGFDKDRVIQVLSELDYRGRNRTTISDDRVVQELL